MQTPTKAQAQAKRWVVEIVTGTVVLVALIAVLLAPKHQPPSTQQAALAKPGVTSTPLTYSDFSGKITGAHDSVVQVLFRGINADGQISEKTYQVNVDQKTELASMTVKAGKTTTTPIALADLKPNDTVFVSGDGNLATLTTFTATKILLSQP